MNRYGFTDSFISILRNPSYTRRYKLLVLVAFSLIVVLHLFLIAAPAIAYEYYGFEYAVVSGFIAVSTIIATRNIRP